MPLRNQAGSLGTGVRRDVSEKNRINEGNVMFCP